MRKTQASEKVAGGPTNQSSTPAVAAPRRKRPLLLALAALLLASWLVFLAVMAFRG